MFKYVVVILSMINILSFNTYAYAAEEREDIIKVGVYEYEPYYYINDKEEIEGYYAEILNLIQSKVNLEYEYVLCDFSEGLKMLEDGELDLIFGLSITDERYKKLIFNKYDIGKEKHGIYTYKDIKYGDLDKISGNKLGLIEDGEGSKWISELLKNRNINTEIIWEKNYSNLKYLLENGEVDFIISPIRENRKENLVYRFSPNQVYIAANKENKELLDKIDSVIESDKNQRKIKDLYEKYFKEKTYKDKITYVIGIVFISFLGGILLIFIVPRIKVNIMKIKIKSRIKNNEYTLYYQPIYNLKEDSISGFESLLRLRGKKGKTLPPAKFIKEIEDNDMLSEVSLWILDKAIKDYKLIKNFNTMKNRDFYISINLSWNEIINEELINKFIKKIVDSKIEKNKICIEIIEKVKINNLDTFNKYIRSLKEAGFIIAVDDFGVEYSNLDVLNKLDFDIIKLDKYFIDDIYSSINENILLFISNITKSNDKKLVIEGVENYTQDNIIRNIKNENIYVQGYLYSKPISIEEIEDNRDGKITNIIKSS